MEKSLENYFDEIVESSLKIAKAKAEQYGTSWTSYRTNSLITRIFNKGKRIVVLQETRENLVGEIISDNFSEIINYTSLVWVMVKKFIKFHSELAPELVLSYQSEFFQKVKEVLLKKDHDYGSAWKEMSQEEIVDEINVKVRRMRKLFDREHSPAVSASVDDGLYDIVNYCVFALILIKTGMHRDG